MKHERKLLHKLIAHLNRKESSVIVGARQTGKTTILNQLAEYLSAMNQKSYFITLEDMRVLNELNEHPENIFRFIPKPDKERCFLLVDEIQYLTNPTNFLKLLYDMYADRLKIIATGSSAFYIDEKFKDSLAGRKKLFELAPLDFEEYLEFNNLEELVQELHNIRTDNNFIGLRRNEINRCFSDYLTFGGYPSVTLEMKNEDKMELLKELLSSFLKKDIAEAGIQQPDKFMNLITILSHQTASLLNVNELSNTIGLSVTAVRNYLYVMEKSFHIHILKPFHNNIRKELTKMPKVYFNDLGLRNALLNNFNLPDMRADKGIAVENYIYIRLRQLFDKESIKFWRTSDGNEVDFIYEQEQSTCAIEAKYSSNEFKESKYRKFIENYPGIPLACRAYISESNNGSILSL